MIINRIFRCFISINYVYLLKAYAIALNQYCNIIPQFGIQEIYLLAILIQMKKFKSILRKGYFIIVTY